MKKTGVLGLLALMMGVLFAACGESHEAMVRQLEALEQMNRADSVMTNDSLAEALTTYFDSHGTANERLRAHYILGRTYADMGNSPDALKTYHSALDECDTLSEDCDFILLSKLCGQMAKLYEEHKLHQHSLSANNSAYHFAMRGKDTLLACVFMEKQVSNYCNMGLEDSALLVSNQTVQLYEEYGDTLAANCSLAPVIMISAERRDFSRMKELLDKYEYNSLLFKNDSLEYENQYLLFYYKGLYYMGVQKYDSAAISFQRLLGKDRSLNNKGLGSKGLYNLYCEVGVTDSIACYANLYTTTLDSIVTQLEHSMIYRQQMLYNYSQHQQRALENEKKAEHSRFLLLLLSAMSVAILLVLLLAFSIYRKRKQAQLFQYQRDLEHLERAQTKLQELRSEEQEHSLNTINSLSEEIATLQLRVAKYTRMSERRTTETSLMESDIVLRLRELLAQNPPAEASLADMRALKSHINEQLPMFYDTLNTEAYTLNPIEYEVCLLIRVHFSPADICKLLGRSDSYIAVTRRRILQKVYGIDGKPKDLDDRILAIQ